MPDRGREEGRRSWPGTQNTRCRANLLRHTSFSVASNAQRTPTYAGQSWLPRAWRFELRAQPEARAELIWLATRPRTRCLLPGPALRYFWESALSTWASHGRRHGRASPTSRSAERRAVTPQRARGAPGAAREPAQGASRGDGGQRGRRPCETPASRAPGRRTYQPGPAHPQAVPRLDQPDARHLARERGRPGEPAHPGRPRGRSRGQPGLPPPARLGDCRGDSRALASKNVPLRAPASSAPSIL